ncbi:aspartate/glutamate racemase family protein [Ornithinibacillus halophilus]|uniref:Aspartate racemase n=1 Tax=Ornithinibacillus halophilus TaxID=930117 RepID=A0A1M5HR07_9BACI|nr:aspartate/glutamate racemase family protein [Ornithinibacillus halophilus]SHG18401.1 aspartate racemase [Ornithinibacillus halophilus]
MKTIGLIGGMSWESTAEYYRLINQLVNKKLGNLHSAKCILYSVDFEGIERYQTLGQWDKAGEELAEVGVNLENAGADFILICTNTMHKVIEQIEGKVNIPILHIADATAELINQQGLQKIGLLGTKYTMEQDFYKSRIEEKEIEVITPAKAEREMINDIIFHELCHGEIRESSRKNYINVIERLIEQGAEGIILGCTEIGLLIKPEHSRVPLFDTTEIHARKAVEEAIR